LSGPLDVTHFISCEENQSIKHITIALKDFELMTSHKIFNPNRGSPIKQLILGLENLQALCPLGGG
jgi:hypothetical protein